MNSRTVDRLIRSVRGELTKAREAGFRRALKHAGYLPQSIDLAVEQHRDWIEKGRRS